MRHFTRKLFSVFARSVIAVWVIVLTTGASIRQDAGSKRIIVAFDHAESLESSLRKIESVSQVSISYDYNLIQSITVRQASFKNEKISVVLNSLLRGTNLTFKEMNGTFLIIKKTTSASIPITGKVMDAMGPMAGVSVIIKNTTGGTSTDAEGQFSLEVESEHDVLVFTMIGYEAQEIVVGQQRSFNVVLKESSQQLEEVVVIGYGTQKKSHLTGSVETVDQEDLKSRPVTAASSALQGQMPGVTIRSYTGKPGANGSEIRIRGIGTLNNANPLVLIDGIEGDMNIINPEDIETISVQKDAASSAIYGARGANGVILITTKKGKKDESPSITYSGYYGVQVPTRLPEFLGSPEYMSLQNESQSNVGRPTTFTDEEIQRAIDGSDPNYYANTDWIGALYKSSAAQQNHNISINGGGPKTAYYLSYGFLDQDGLIVGNNFGAKRHNLRTRISTRLLDKLELEGILGYIDRKNTESSWVTDENSGVIYSAHTISPLIPVKFTNGGWGYGGGSTNPIAIATDGGDNVFSSQEVTGNFKATVEVIKGLKLATQYGLVMSNSNRNIFTRKVVYYYPEDGKYWYTSTQFNSLDVRNYVNRYQSFIATADYDKSFGSHHLHFLAGYSQEWNRNEYFQASRQDFVSDELEALNGGTQNQRNSGEAYHWALRSGFGRLNYDFKDKYLFEANVRYDGTSRFAQGNRFGVFPSFSVGWRLSEESFMSFSNTFMTTLKLRASWGKLGNQYITSQSSNFAYYPYISAISSVGTMPIGSVITPAYAQTVLANESIDWESITMTNVGLDASFLNARLNLTADWFIKTTNDILLKVPLPDVLGLNEPEQNAGAVENRGLELNLGWQDRVGSVKYKVNVLYSNIKNKVTHLGNVPPTYGDQIRQVNYPVDAFYGLVADRIAQEADFDYDADTEKYTPKFPIFTEDANIVRPGDIIYKDLNADNRITLDGDRQAIGKPFPQHTFSLRGEMDWKGLDFSFFFQGVTNVDGYLKGSSRNAFTTESAYPQKVHLDRWTPENTDATYPRLTYQRGHNQRFSTFWLENAAYVRLKNIQIGYTLPMALIRRARFESVRIYASADNLFTSTDFFKSYDPETPVSSGGYYPQVKTFIVGVNMTLK